MRIQILSRSIARAALMLFAAIGANAYAASGVFTFVIGPVSVKTGNLERQAQRGMEVNQGDVVTTGRDGMAQLTMTDQAQLSLRSNSSLTIEVYPQVRNHNGAVLTLTRGTLRAFTKLLTASASSGYRMRTKVATVGIRGSDNIMETDDVRTVVFTIDGSHIVSSNSGSFMPIITLPNQAVLVVPGQAPQIIPTPPSLLDAAKTIVGSGGGTAGGGDGAGGGGEAPPQGTFTGGQPNVVGGNGLGYTLIDATNNLTADPNNLQNIVVALNGTALSDQAIPAQITLENGAMRGYTAYAGGQSGTALNVIGGTVADLQSVRIGNATSVVVGRWSNPTGISFTGTAFSPAGSTHFAYGGTGFPAYLSDVLTGTVSYTRVAATTPTNQFGTLGSITSATLDVNFTARTLNAAVGISMPAGTGAGAGNWNMIASNVPFSFNSFVAFTGNGRLAVTNGNNQNVEGWLEGSFVGAALNGAIIGYGIRDQRPASTGSDNQASTPGALQVINGVIVFSGPPQNAAAPYREGIVSDVRGVLSVASYIRSFTTTNRPAEVTEGANGAVSAFTAPYVGNNQIVGHTPYQQGTATIAESGANAATGLVWGRWSGGTATIGGQQVALGNQSLHYIFGPAQSGPVSLPLTGTAVYDVVGSTRPTDSNGNVGTFNSATLNANLSARTVDTSVNVAINGQTWNGSATGVPIYRDQYFSAYAGSSIPGIPRPALFNITCSPNCTPQFRTGSIDGFFTGRSGSGAGVMYNMNGIAGAVAFARRPG